MRSLLFQIWVLIHELDPSKAAIFGPKMPQRVENCLQQLRYADLFFLNVDNHFAALCYLIICCVVLKCLMPAGNLYYVDYLVFVISFDTAIPRVKLSKGSCAKMKLCLFVFCQKETCIFQTYCVDEDRIFLVSVRLQYLILANLSLQTEPPLCFSTVHDKNVSQIQAWFSPQLR